MRTRPNWLPMIESFSSCLLLVAFSAFSPSLLVASPQFVAREDVKLIPNDPVEGAHFGSSVALFGNTLLVSAPWTRAAYVFVRNGYSWTQQAKLIVPVGLHEQLIRVSLFGDTALISTDESHSGFEHAGSVFVFVRNGAKWQQQARLVASKPGYLSYFGASLSIFADTALIGADDDDLGTDAGAAYVFVRNGIQWTEQQRLTASNPLAYQHFGWDVGLHINTAVVGTGGVGWAYVFDRVGTSWSESARLVPITSGTSKGFGAPVSIYQDTVVVGWWSNSVHVFSRGSGWLQEAELLAPEGKPFTGFGITCKLFGDHIIVGGLLTHTGSGYAHVFERSGAGWHRLGKLLPLDGGEPGDDYGTAVTIFAETAVVGSWGDNHLSFADVGSAHVYKIRPAPAVFCTAKAALSCGAPSIDYTGAPSATSASGFMIQAGPARPHRLGLLLYTNGGRRVPALPFAGGVLCLLDPLSATGVVSSGGTGNCDGSFQLDMNCFAAGTCSGKPTHYLKTPGQPVCVQWYGRDSVATGPFLSEALEYHVWP